jgi:hypothetical protein
MPRTPVITAPSPAQLSPLEAVAHALWLQLPEDDRGEDYFERFVHHYWGYNPGFWDQLRAGTKGPEIQKWATDFRFGLHDLDGHLFVTCF